MRWLSPLLLFLACGPGLDSSVLNDKKQTNPPVTQTSSSTGQPANDTDDPTEAPNNEPDPTPGPSGPTGPVGTSGPSVVVETMIGDRSKLGARSIVSYRPWRGGIAVKNGKVYWVEGGTSPGLYSRSATTPCTTTSCADSLAVYTRPSAFYATDTHVYVADVTVLRRWAFSGGTSENVVTHSAEIVSLAAAGDQAIWTADTDSAVNFTTVGGNTSTPIYSNGTPIAMGIAGTSVFWTGADISGLQVAIQTIGLDKKGAREVVRFSSGFHTLRGNGTFLYYAEAGNLHRTILASGHDDVVAKDVANVREIAVDGSYAYWVEAGTAPDYKDGRVRRIAHDETVAQTLAVGIALPLGIAVDGNNAFVLSAGTKPSYADGKILRLTISQ